MDFEFWERCPKCGNQLVNEANLWKLRGIIGGCAIGGAALGAITLPLLGFGAGGVAAGSAAAAWQSSIGSVAAGSLFAILQSLGATGIGILLFGSVGAGLGLLSSSAAAIGWCTCDTDTKAEPLNNSLGGNEKENIVKEKEDSIIGGIKAANNDADDKIV
ncbi:interferon alpha-inducible protein 6-like [Bradysia coprophila]|uniref:interferon alpha-inducible protein 6-like n=1 Tax=Bradysia coprophila TaxID=38358 RepID=UPI00187DB3F8|nr:interferon alpha-inducible protein 6-like [Bradysia coprophila]XP_037046390.1 interferon alpha-inducible protein 6-like [Bradysia coprophila]XP_037046391.1 interferon alpha-inducible protein 6-like [Bradysia coprophila]